MTAQPTCFFIANGWFAGRSTFSMSTFVKSLYCMHAIPHCYRRLIESRDTHGIAKRYVQVKTPK